jgi:glyceraldehyde 3-phosphate dehydrogenase
MTVRVGINGFGRIGRNFFKAAKQRGADIDFVAANDPFGSKDLMAHLLRHDTVQGNWVAERDPAKLPWADLGVDVVIESTGVFSSKEQASAHLTAGAPLVIVSQPSAGADATFVVGVNDDTFDASVHKVVSNASCTTNCFVPMVKVLDDAFGIEKGLMTTVHAYTATQAIVDGPSKDLREARAAAVNVIPSTTGAARATALVLEAMKGKLDGTSLRVPVPDGSITDFTAILNKEASVDEINAAFKAASESGPLAAVLEYSEAPIVSSDIVGSPASCTFDAPLTMAMGNLVKVFGWYDNEWGYSNRVVDLILRTAGK